MKNDILKDILVVDFTQALAGPYCSALLANNGARVIKIERADGGDMLRKAGPFDDEGISLFWASVNSNKESCVLNFKSQQDMKIIHNIIAKADVLLENFRPGVMDKLGLGYQDVIKVNPNIVYTSSSGFGHSGPMATAPGFDMVGQGYSGIMTVNGDSEKWQGRIGFPIGDYTLGMWSYMATMTALYNKAKTGHGAYTDQSMLDGLFALMSTEVTAYMKTGEIAHPTGNADPCSTPFGVIKTKDGAVVVAVLGEKLWLAFCNVIGKPELTSQAEFKTPDLRLKNRKLLQSTTHPIFEAKTTAEWLKLLTAGGVPNGVVNNIKEACELPQIKARDMLVESGDYMVPGNPMKIDCRAIKSPFSAPEKLGQSTQKIIQEFA